MTSFVNLASKATAVAMGALRPLTGTTISVPAAALNTISFSTPITITGDITLGPTCTVRGPLTVVDSANIYTGGLDVDAYNNDLHVTSTQNAVEIPALLFNAWTGATVPQTVLSGYSQYWSPWLTWVGPWAAQNARIRCFRLGELVSITSDLSSADTTGADYATLNPAGSVPPEYLPTDADLYVPASVTNNAPGRPYILVC